MPDSNGVVRPSRHDSAVGMVVRHWRRLTGGSERRDQDRRTLVACSGGADSSALTLCLASATDRLVVAHVVHDLRPRTESLADRAKARELAAGLGVPFVEEHVRVVHMPGNDEANARHLRYEALERLAFEQGCPYIATAHHAEDQLETMLMGLVRGTGLAGLAGVRPRRPVGERGIQAVRPMLRLARVESERICRDCGWVWADDPSNRDVTRLRAALRAGPVKELLRIRPATCDHAVNVAEFVRDAASLVEDAVAQEWPSASVVERDGRVVAYSFDRARLRGLRWIVVGSLLRSAYARLRDGEGLDRLRARSVRAAAMAIRHADDAREFQWQGARVLVGRDRVEVRLEEGEHE
ncbi:MAG TPA: tRNA lysidine(34) synthetase TilS [Phycisphaerales bacterium]|nr:tRNA lysidine(34) synthetase TilS [Phycisphaerales bacterium]